MRRLAVLVCLLPLVAACGGGSKSSAPPASTGVEAPDPGKQAFATLVHAAVQTDRKAMSRNAFARICVGDGASASAAAAAACASTGG